jgi:hypothetical protein
MARHDSKEGQDSNVWASDYIRHRLRMFGLDPESLETRLHMSFRASDPRDLLSIADSDEDCVMLAILPNPSVLEAVGVMTLGQLPRASNMTRMGTHVSGHAPLRSLLPGMRYKVAPGQTCLLKSADAGVWIMFRLRRCTIIIAGTCLPEDLLLFAQGDPIQAEMRPTEELWGIPGERPNYLFEGIRCGYPTNERHADNWIWFLRQTLVAEGFHSREPLPEGAPGAVVITGDDDQATLDKYEAQRATLEGLPITYFLHHLSNQTKKSLKGLESHGRTEFGLHPDALDLPAHYRQKLREQAAWFESLVGYGPRVVRNHGFLNDGYWGHAAGWIEEGLVASSNIPGFDGNLLTGSLLPCRLILNEALTDHWSILTTFGDGMVFAAGYSDEEASRRIVDLATSVKSSGMPGVISLNLHPQNIAETPFMHQAVRDLAELGFVPWTLGECIDWFSSLDGTSDTLCGPSKGRGRPPWHR